MKEKQGRGGRKLKYTIPFKEIRKKDLALVGGKGANLGELSAAGFPVPEGFCITTRAFHRFIETSREMNTYYGELKNVDVENLTALKNLGEKIRNHLHSLSFPEDIREEVLSLWKMGGSENSYAIRSSATAEDLPGTSFAGQQETYLNIKGEENLLQYIQRCWASLFTDRAIAYREKNGFDHKKVSLSVVIQPMIFPEVSGILFTADPINGHRQVVSIDASYGLGEALVSGIVTPDLYKVKDGQILSKKIGHKKIGIYGTPTGGTIQQEIPKEMAEKSALTDEQILILARWGKKIEDHYSSPQDIEWALVKGQFYILQSRPITSLYPVPQVKDKSFLHVFISFGHQQMMTDAMKPMGISIMKNFSPFGKKDEDGESEIMAEAGSRIYIDVTYLLHIPFLRKKVPGILRNMDESISRGISEIVCRNDFLSGVRRNKEVRKTFLRFFPKVIGQVFINYMFRDLTKVKENVEKYMSTELTRLESELSALSGVARIRRMQERMAKGMSGYFFHLFPFVITGVSSYHVVKKLNEKWLGNRKYLQDLGKSLKGNVTLEMGLALGDVADVARNFPNLLAYFKRPKENTFFDDVKKIEGGELFLQSFQPFLDRYGMRCPGEIDVTQTRWRENPTSLLAAMLGHIQSTEPGEHRDKFKTGELEGEKATREIITSLKGKPMGFLKGKIMSRIIQVFRTMMALREHPKFMIIQCFWIYKKAILEEGKDLVSKGLLKEEEDVYYLKLSELASILEGSFHEDVANLIEKRREEYRENCHLVPPRVITSEGEIIKGTKRVENLPQGALPGSPVSPGVIEGNARVVLNPEEGKLEKGDILVAPFTDPGWTPLFISAKGLVMEVGGLMTHGAVVAREYGIPAVVGVENATKAIRDGQRIRVHGDLGYVEILES